MEWTVREAKVARYTEEEAGLAYVAVSLAEQPGGQGRYIEFQLGLDEAERADGYCVVDAPAPHWDDGEPVEAALMCASHKTLYGGVKECRIDGDVLTLRFNRAARHVFGWPRKTTLLLDIGTHEREALVRGLAEVLAVGPDGKRTKLVC